MPPPDASGRILLELGLILLTGYLAGSVANFFKLPRVSGYIIAGIIMSPSLTGIIDEGFLKRADIVTHATLSVITFLIGSSLSWRNLKRYGKSILLITFGEAEFAFLLVCIAMGLYLFLSGSFETHLLIPIALIFGSLASPTDPTATLAVIHEYKTKGDLTTTVLGVTALDDAFGIVNFVVGFSAGVSILAGKEIEAVEIAYKLFYEIAGALILGLVMGFVMAFLGRFARTRKELVTLTIGLLFLTFAIAKTIGTDELLSTMMTGVVIANLRGAWEKFEKPLEDYIEDLIFTAFFVVGSAFLDIRLLISLTPIILIYVVSRFVGKTVGVYAGSRLSDAQPQVRKLLPLTLFPQGGIVIGLALLVYQTPQLKEAGSLLVNVVIGATVIHEFMGPVFSKIAFERAGEIETSRI